MSYTTRLTPLTLLMMRAAVAPRKACPSFLAVEQRPPCRNPLKQDIEVADIRGQHHEAELLRLQEQRTVMERPQLGVP
jgi:hypothetical protein